MKGPELIIYRGTILGMRVRSPKAGVQSITDESGPVQILTQVRKKGELVLAHAHKPTKRLTQNVQECLVVISGQVRVDLYANEKKVVKRVLLGAGDLFLHMAGAHALTVLKNAKFYEIKNGPYKNDRVNLVV